MLNGKSLLITGGTGSFGQAFVRSTLEKYPRMNRMVIFSRDEFKQSEMMKVFPPEKYRQLRYFLGDVRDRERLTRALTGINYVIHAAALKQVTAAEYNPIEFVQTNIIGARNVIEAAIDTGVKRVVALSTDKAAAPINLYGATKLCSDKLFSAANEYAGTGARFAIVRYGNVFGSRGSVAPLFLEKARSGVLPITDPSMTRFHITLREGVDLVLWVLEHAFGGEIFVPKIPSFKVIDLAKAIGPNCEHQLVGVRPGEKLHEDLITASDSVSTVDLGEKFAILPMGNKDLAAKYLEQKEQKMVDPNFSYRSNENAKFLTPADLVNLVRAEIDSSFQPV
jgi:UDP-N-acetylglucosamine 4,6-dehydratase/5-epimerase